MDICRQKDHKPWSRPSFCGLSGGEEGARQREGIAVSPQAGGVNASLHKCCEVFPEQGFSGSKHCNVAFEFVDGVLS